MVTRHMVCGLSTGAVLIAMGIVALVYSVPRRKDDYDGDQSCDELGAPPLRDWLFGTGIAFIVIACSYFITAQRERDGEFGGGIFGCIAHLSSSFLFCWAIVGSVSLGTHAKACKDLAPPLWSAGCACVVMNWIIWCCGGYVSSTYFYSYSSGSEQEGGNNNNKERRQNQV